MEGSLTRVANWEHWEQNINAVAAFPPQKHFQKLLSIRVLSMTRPLLTAGTRGEIEF